MMQNYTKKEVDMFGTVCHYNSNRQYHRLDGPAIEWANGSAFWYINGKRHRLAGPAVKYFGRYEEWFINDQFYSNSNHNRLYLFSILEPQRIDLNSTED
jgi:hypothetical protein